MRPYNATTPEWLVYTLLGIIADTLDTVLTAISPPKKHQRSVLVSSSNMLPSECSIDNLTLV